MKTNLTRKLLITLITTLSVLSLNAQSRNSWYSKDLAVNFTRVTDQLYWSNSMIDSGIKYHFEVNFSKNFPRYTLVTEPHHDEASVSKVIKHHLNNNGTVKQYLVEEKHSVVKDKYYVYFLVKPKPKKEVIQ
ncbi:hypothetical protein [Flammeovirga pacifica]|uniref:Uncharacterized protein n=1 Tax=Flammeovirga pacifica TaxID=915059 RepID=A0A1S1YSY3_FLAPC|nr:hypothetical protein [Flammeovirga pacifica]OHX64141.1 hypothetical protein NH26_21285 [Flammeovirga pacifica]